MPRPVKRVNYTWKVLWDAFGTPATIGAAGGATAQTQAALITQAELEDLDDNVKIKRLVGEMYFFFQAQDGASALSLMQLTQGIVINNAAASANYFFASPTDAQDNPWIWLRNYMLTGTEVSNEGGNTANVEDAGGFMTAHIDLPINRRLGEGDRLLLVSEAISTGAVAWQVFMWRRLRILCEV